MNTPPSYEDIRSQIERRYRRYALFLFHVIIALVTGLAIWIIYPISLTYMFLLGLGWFGLLALHGVKVLMDNARDREIERAWARFSDSVPYMDMEKPKRIMRLSDDSEVEVVDEMFTRRNSKR